MEKVSLAERVRALEREMADALDAKMLAKFNLSPHHLAESVCSQLSAIAAECERIAGECRETTARVWSEEVGMGLHACEVDKRIRAWAAALADPKEGV